MIMIYAQIGCFYLYRNEHTRSKDSVKADHR
jgi:hypothetical protein